MPGEGEFRALTPLANTVTYTERVKAAASCPSKGLCTNSTSGRLVMLLLLNSSDRVLAEPPAVVAAGRGDAVAADEAQI